MASKKEIMKRLNERKNVLIEFLDEYNKLYVNTANRLISGRYAGLGMRISQKLFDKDPLCLYGCYDYLTNIERTKRLQEVFHKREKIEGHEKDLRLMSRSYTYLASRLSLSFSNDVHREIVESPDFPELIKKFDACGFTPAEVAALSHLLFFEQVSFVPQEFTGLHPTYYSLLESFLSRVRSFEYSLSEKNKPHQAFCDNIRSHADVDLEGLLVKLN